MIDKWSFLPILAVVYTSIVMPLISFFVSPPATMQSTLQSAVEGQLANRIFWPAMAASSVVLVMRNRSRIGKLIYLPILPVSSRFLRLLEQVRCGLSNRSFRSLGLLRKPCFLHPLFCLPCWRLEQRM